MNIFPSAFSAMKFSDAAREKGNEVTMSESQATSSLHHRRANNKKNEQPTDKVVRKDDSMVANPAGFSDLVKRNAILKVLEACADSLVVYRNTMKRSEATTREKSLLEIDLYVSDIMRDLRQEISERGTIEILIKEIERIQAREKQERLLTEENERIRAIATELRRAIADKKMSNEKEKMRLREKLTLTRDEKERLKLIKDVEMRYVRAWEKTRREQNVLRYELEIDERKETLNDYHVRERNENRVTGELTRHLTRRITLIGNRIEQWQQRYDREREMYERQICKVRNEIEDARKYLEKLTTEYCGNQELIDTYLAEQEALKRQKEHEDHVQSSTIRMQAWWRGIMVRRKLGPYRPEEKRKKRAVKK